VKTKICGINFLRKTFSKFGFNLIGKLISTIVEFVYPFALAISKEKVSLLKV